MRRGTGLAAASAALLLGGCAQLGPSVPEAAAAPVSGPVTSTATTTAPPVETTGPATVTAAASRTTAQLGIQIYWHGVSDPHQVITNADRLLDYAAGLGANSVGLSFPIYTDGMRPTRVYTEPSNTPSPATLTTVIGEAKKRGLRVMLRPVIDETNLKGRNAWRGSIKPPDVDAWFASYRQTLTPYLTAARDAHADTFVLGSELDSLAGYGSRWKALRSAAATIFTGDLAYADNWGEWATGRAGVEGVVPGLDAYPQLKLDDAASVARIRTAWTTWLRKRPQGLTSTVVQEIGIAGITGAYREPAVWGVQQDDLKPEIQTKWFAGACQAIRALHMSGVYFWNVDSAADPANASAYSAGSFIGRGDAAIRECFASGWPGQ